MWWKECIWWEKKVQAKHRLSFNIEANRVGKKKGFSAYNNYVGDGNLADYYIFYFLLNRFRYIYLLIVLVEKSNNETYLEIN